MVESRSVVWLVCGPGHHHEPYKAYVLFGRKSYRVDSGIRGPLRYEDESEIDAYVAEPQLRVTKVYVDPTRPRTVVGLRVTLPKPALAQLVAALSLSRQITNKQATKEAI